MQPVASANQEAVEAWNGVLFDRFSQYRHLILAGLEPHGEEGLRIAPPRPGDRVIDIGCGFGDTTQRLGELVGADGRALGIDASERFIEAAGEEAEAAGASNVSFMVGDLQSVELEPGLDYAFARMGTMFFASPVAAMGNVRGAMKPGARLCMIVWRQKIDNPWIYEAEQVVERFVTEDEDSDEPTCGPGPFSMANADTTSEILRIAGFEEISFRRSDLPFRFGADLDEAIGYLMALGPAGEVLRLAGEDAKRLEPEIVAALRDALAEYVRPDGVWGNMSSWIVTARVPGEAA